MCGYTYIQSTAEFSNTATNDGCAQEGVWPLPQVWTLGRVALLQSPVCFQVGWCPVHQIHSSDILGPASDLGDNGDGGGYHGDQCILQLAASSFSSLMGWWGWEGDGMTFLWLLDKFGNIWVAMAVAMSPWMYPHTLQGEGPNTMGHLYQVVWREYLNVGNGWQHACSEKNLPPPHTTHTRASTH